MTSYAEKLLPHNLEAEEAVLGSLLIDPDALSRVSSLIKPKDFYQERHGQIYAAALSLQRRDISIDQTTVASELHRLEEVAPGDSMPLLSHLVSITPTSVHAEDYAQLVASAATMRQLIQASARIAELGYNGGGDIEATLRKAEDALSAVRGAAPGRDFVPLREIYDEYLQDQQTAVEEMGIPVMTGFPEIDETLGGIQKSDLVVLGARPSVGKTSLAMNIVVNAAKQGHRCGVFSLEMSRQQLALRILASESGVDFHRLRLGIYTIAEEQRIIDTIGRLSELPVYVDDTRFQTMPEIHSKARRLSLENGLDVLVLDYMQLVQGRPGMNNRTNEISEISRSLKVLAGDLKVALFTCSQLNRMIEHRQGHRPQLSDLRDSGSIEQDADVVMLIHREDHFTTEEEWNAQHPGQTYPANMADVIIAKHRNGPTGGVQLFFRDSLVRFESV